MLELQTPWSGKSLEHNNDESLNKELESIDSKKHSLGHATTKELLDTLDGKMQEIAQKSKKLKRLEDKTKWEENGTRAEEEIKN